MKSDNFMMAEFRLPVSVAVADGYITDHIAFTSSGILAILELADPKLIAEPEQITNQMDAEPMIAELIEQGVATREKIEKELKFRKFMGEKTIFEETEIDEKFNLSFQTTIKRSISNVVTHPGKTLYGCSYRIEMEDLPTVAKSSPR